MNKELEKLVGPFVQARYDWQEQQKEEIRLHAEVLAFMRTKKIPTYCYRDGEVLYELELVTRDERVKVKRHEDSTE